LAGLESNGIGDPAQQMKARSPQHAAKLGYHGADQAEAFRLLQYGLC